MLERLIVFGIFVLMVLGATSEVLLKSRECVPDDHLIGRVALSSENQPGTWWGITRAGFRTAGTDVDDAEVMLDVLNGWLGTEFTELRDAIDAFVDTASAFDANANGFVCAYDAGAARRRSFGDPILKLHMFGISDDKSGAL